MKNIKVYAVHHDAGHWTIRTAPVAKKWTEGPDKDCEVFEAILSPKAARSISLIYQAQEHAEQARK